MTQEFIDVLVIGAGPSGCVSASYLHNNNVKVKVVEGDRENIKITTPEDLLLAEAILKKRKTPSLRGVRRRRSNLCLYFMRLLCVSQ